MTLFATFAAVAATLADPTAAAPAPAPSPAAPAAAPARKGERQYCVVDTFTGSRIPRKVCHSLAEWKEQGVDTSSWTAR